MKYNIFKNIISNIKTNRDIIVLSKVLSSINSNYERKIIVGIAFDSSKSAKNIANKIINCIKNYNCSVSVVCGEINSTSHFLKRNYCDVSLYLYNSKGIHGKVISANGYELDMYYRILFYNNLKDCLDLYNTQKNTISSYCYIKNISNFDKRFYSKILKNYNCFYNIDYEILKTFCRIFKSNTTKLLSKVRYLISIDFFKDFKKNINSIVFNKNSINYIVKIKNNEFIVESNYLTKKEQYAVLYSLVLFSTSSNNFLFVTKKYAYILKNNAFKKLKNLYKYDIIKLALESSVQIAFLERKIFLTNQLNFDANLVLLVLAKFLGEK